ncbi:MAG: hypothetical protein LBJ93_03965 [Clostridiales bacterium]|jgi:hypothetical protein|nr:hypothetical protein [Clostridiales bacterium]
MSQGSSLPTEVLGVTLEMIASVNNTEELFKRYYTVTNCTMYSPRAPHIQNIPNVPEYVCPNGVFEGTIQDEFCKQIYMICAINVQYAHIISRLQEDTYYDQALLKIVQLQIKIESAYIKTRSHLVINRINLPETLNSWESLIAKRCGLPQFNPKLSKTIEANVHYNGAARTILEISRIIIALGISLVIVSIGTGTTDILILKGILKVSVNFLYLAPIISVILSTITAIIIIYIFAKLKNRTLHPGALEDQKI